MKFIIQKKWLILSILFFIISIFVFISLFKEISSNKEVLQTTQKEWQIEENYRENIRILTSSLESIKEKKVLLENHFIDSSDVVPFLNNIENIAKEVGVKAEVINVNVAKDSSTLIVEMRAQGTFEIIYKLITLLENSPYTINFVSVDLQNISSDTSKTSQWLVSLKIKLLSFIK